MFLRINYFDFEKSDFNDQTPYVRIFSFSFSFSFLFYLSEDWLTIFGLMIYVLNICHSAEPPVGSKMVENYHLMKMLVHTKTPYLHTKTPWCLCNVHVICFYTQRENKRNNRNLLKLYLFT